MNSMVSWKDYDGVNGFGQATASDVAELNKALHVNQDISKPSVAAGEGFALRVESLESTLKVTTWTMQEIKLWKSIPKLPAYNTVEEHNTLSSFGENLDNMWIDEGDLPESDDSTYERDYAVVKYLGTTRSVSHVATMIKPAHGNIIAQETVNGTMQMLRAMEKGLYYGNSSLSALQFDGYEKLLTDNAPAANIVDLRGAYLTEDILSDAARTIQESYGAPTHLHINTQVHGDLGKTFFPKERMSVFDDKTGVIGNNLSGFQGPTGIVVFEPSVFITDGGAYNAAATGAAATRPGTPTISTSLAASGTTSQFTADDAGSYYYTIVACNRYGKSAPVDANEGGGAFAVAATQVVTFSVTPAASFVGWYEIYRTVKGGADGTERLIQRVANSAGAGAQVITDVNATLPGTTSGFMFQQNLQSMSFKQLAPMVKIPLATIDTSIRWSQVIYGVPVLYAPGKNLLFKNIGRLAQ